MNEKEIKNEITKSKIIMILKKHLLDSISIKEFKEMTDILELGDVNLKLRNIIIEEAHKEVRKIQFDDEWDLLEMMEEGSE